MSVCKTKNEFMLDLENEIKARGIADYKEILGDFEEHFVTGVANGESEEDVCVKLGDTVEIADQYAQEDPNSHPKQNENQTSEQVYEQVTIQAVSPKRFRTGGLIGAIACDIFFFSWAVPTFFVITIAMILCGITSAIGGIVLFLSPMMPFLPVSYPTFLSPFSVIMGGIAMVALGGLLGLLGRVMIKACIAIINGIVKFHRNSIYS